jgi:hypothetical protein
MGRPLKKSLFGSTAANNLKVQFNNGTASKPGIIIKQKGAKRFLCQDKAGVQAVCTLVDKAAGALLPGEMSLTVKTDAGTIKQVTKISAHKLTTADGSFLWNFSTSTTDGAVQVEEAGTTVADVPLTGATNLEGDVEA